MGEAHGIPPLPASSGNINLQMIDPLKGYYISGKIYSTQDGGNTWKTINPVSWSGQPDFIDFNHGWAVARNGEQIALVQTTNGGVNWDMLTTTITQ